MKEFDQCLDAPLDCELDLVALGCAWLRLDGSLEMRRRELWGKV
jgi:hypothetical protein